MYFYSLFTADGFDVSWEDAALFGAGGKVVVVVVTIVWSIAHGQDCL